MLFFATAALAGSAERMVLERVSEREAHRDQVSWRIERSVPWAGGKQIRLRPTVLEIPVESTRVISLGVHDEWRRDQGRAVLDPTGFDPVPSVDEALAIELGSQWIHDLMGGT